MFAIIIDMKYDNLAAERAGIMYVIGDRAELKEFANIMRFGRLRRNGGDAEKPLEAKTLVS